MLKMFILIVLSISNFIYHIGIAVCSANRNVAKKNT